MLAHNNPENQESIVASGGLAALLKITQVESGDSVEVQAEAVLALAEIARCNQRNQTSLGNVAAVSSLV